MYLVVCNGPLNLSLGPYHVAFLIFEIIFFFSRENDLHTNLFCSEFQFILIMPTVLYRTNLYIITKTVKKSALGEFEHPEIHDKIS